MTKQSCVGLVLGLGITIGLGMVTYGFYAASVYLTPAGALLLYVLVIYIVFTKTVQIVVFPGSTWHCKKDMEARYCKSLCIDVCSTLNTIISALESSSQADLNSIHYQDVPINLSLLIKIKDNLTSIQNNTNANKPQKKLLAMLDQLLSLLRIDKNEKETAREQEDVYLNNSNYMNSIKASKSIISFLSGYIYKRNCWKFFLFLFKKPLGDANYMRNNLLLELNGEQIWVPTDDNCKLDW
jgi:hypothetical protein